MQFKVPQNIDMADKIIGPLTMIQFLYLMGGGMICYVVFESIKGATAFLIILPVALFSLALAFLKVQDQPFLKFLVALLFYLVKPKTRIWWKIPEEEKFKFELQEKKTYKKIEGKTTYKQVEKSELEKLANILDTGKPLADKEATKQKETQEGLEDIFDLAKTQSFGQAYGTIKQK